MSWVACVLGACAGDPGGHGGREVQPQGDVAAPPQGQTGLGPVSAGTGPGQTGPGQTTTGDAPAGVAGAPAPPPPGGQAGAGATAPPIPPCQDGFQRVADGCSDATGFACQCPDSAPPASAASCDLTGTFAVRAEMMVRWDAAVVLGMTAVAAGQATNTSHGIWRIRREGGVLVADASSCGGDTPDLCSPALGESFGQGFPESIWDSGATPVDRWTLQVTDESPGGALSAGPVAAFFGLRMTSGDPQGPFPATASDANLMWVDDDGDGNPGVTARITPPGGTSASCGMPYGYLPVDDGLFPARASEIYMGLRTVADVAGTLTDCDTATGTLTTHSADARVQGCRLDDGAPCSEAQRRFLDEQPRAQQILGTTFTMKRVDEAGLSCAAVRSLAF